jgi:adenine-specific DNA-methyltransferase
MTKRQKLELTWIGKVARPKLEPHILLEDPSKSYLAKQRVSDADLFDNRLIFGDNLLALKALGQFNIYYRSGVNQPEYIPDFVAAMDDVI